MVAFLALFLAPSASAAQPLVPLHCWVQGVERDELAEGHGVLVSTRREGDGLVQSSRLVKVDDDGSFHIEVPANAVEIQATVPGYLAAPLRFDLSTGACQLAQPQPAPAIEGVIEPALSGNRIVGCGFRGKIDDDGRFGGHTTELPCTLRATRQHGGLTAYSEAVHLDVASAAAPIALTLPDAPYGTTGFRVVQSEQGSEVWAIAAGSQAFRAGIRCRDVIVAADGQSLTGLPIEDVAAALVGTAGSVIEVEVVHPWPDAPVRKLALELAAGPAPDPSRLCPR